MLSCPVNFFGLVGQSFFITFAFLELACSFPETSNKSCEDFWHATRGDLFPGLPHGASEEDRVAWWQNLQGARTACRKGFNASIFQQQALVWTQTSYVQPQMHPFDRFFYNEEDGYTVERYLDDLTQRYGGVDSVLLWPTYPNIGVDNRNQFDYFRALPGGLSALRTAVKTLHAHGVMVLYPYNPWDLQTRLEGVTHMDAMAALLDQTSAQGFNGDTMDFANYSFYSAGVQPIAIEPEAYGRPDMRNWHTLGWGYWEFLDPFVPQVDFSKFAVDSRWMTHGCERWSMNHTQFIQNAFFNGVGFESWENVWGSWNGIVPRDAELLRRAAKIERYFGKLGYLIAEDWTPFAEEVRSDKVYASRFPLTDGVLYLLVNRFDVSSDAGLQVPAISAGKPRAFDCYSGKELLLTASSTVSVSVEGLGIGCVFFTSIVSDGFQNFLEDMLAATSRPLGAFSTQYNILLQKMVNKSVATNSKGMVKIPPVSDWHFKCTSVQREGDDAHGGDVQYPWESSPRREHDHVMDLATFFIDKYPVTMADYADYLNATGYVPKDTYNWLSTWNWTGGKPRPVTDLLRTPVTHVSLNEAKLFCSWKGARLPHSYEWQYAAQGSDGRLYPWGNTKDADRFPLPLNNSHDNPVPARVDAHPHGASPFGVQDLVGNVWQYTDEFEDIHTRAVVLRGSSAYVPDGSIWYFPAALELNKHNKYFLMSDSYERAATIGFRCAADNDDDAMEIVV